MDFLAEVVQWHAMDTAQKLALGCFAGYGLASLGFWGMKTVLKIGGGNGDSDDSTTTATNKGRRRVKGGRFDDEEEKESPIDGVVKVLKWVHCPVISVAFLFNFASSDTEYFLAKIPALFWNYGKQSLKSALGLHPTTLEQGFQLGVIYNQLIDSATGALRKGLDGTALLQDLLKKAASIVGREDQAASLAEILQLPTVIAEMTQGTGVMHRVLSVFSLVNFIWLISILGLTVTLGPFLWYMAKPLRAILVKLWTDFIYPTILALQPVYEYFFYALSCYIAVESMRYKSDDNYSMTGTMIALTSFGGFALSWLWTTYRNAKGGGDQTTYLRLTCLLALGVAIPLGKLHNSILIGDVASAGIFTLLMTFDFIDACFWGRSRYDRWWYSVYATCLWMSLGNAAIRAVQPNNEWLSPLQHGVSIVSTIILFSTALFQPFRYHTYYNRSSSRLIGNTLFLGTAAVYYGLGQFLNMAPLSNISIFFTGLYMFGTYVDLCPKSHGAFIVSTFVGFGILYAMSLHLSAHPEIVVSLMSFGGK